MENLSHNFDIGFVPNLKLDSSKVDFKTPHKRNHLLNSVTAKRIKNDLKRSFLPLAAKDSSLDGSDVKRNSSPFFSPYAARKSRV